MAKIIFSNGQSVELDYNKAAKIYQILIGNAEPEDEKQAEFVSRVKEVKFDNEKRKGQFNAKPNN